MAILTGGRAKKRGTNGWEEEGIQELKGGEKHQGKKIVGGTWIGREAR